LIAGPDGNVSVRLAPDRILVTPGGMSKVDVTAGDLVEVTLAGVRSRGPRQPSSELAMHLRIYQRRADVGAVVHAHPPYATAFAAAGMTLPGGVLPEIILQMGSVPLVPYGTPGTAELADQFEPYLALNDAFLMANHGAATIGPTLGIAHQRMESLEHAASILVVARLLGGARPLPADRLRDLEAARARATGGARHPARPTRDGARRTT
jgi:L-fuculose-phosphate aldolase